MNVYIYRSRKIMSAIVAVVMLILCVTSYSSTDVSAVNSAVSYSVFDISYDENNVQSGDYIEGYTLSANPVQDNSRDIIGSQDTRAADTSLGGVVKLITQDGLVGTGFVIDSYTIATAAHCLFDYESDSLDGISRLPKSILVFDSDGEVELTITDFKEAHIPDKYIEKMMAFHTATTDAAENRYYNQAAAYDYALITVDTDLSAYACFELGIMLDGMIGDVGVEVYCTGFPEYTFYNQILRNNATRHKKMTASGYIVDDYTNMYNDISRSFCHTIDATIGNSGGPVYTKTTYNGTDYYTVIGIHTRGIDGTKNGGVQFTTETLHFYKNNPNV